MSDEITAFHHTLNAYIKKDYSWMNLTAGTGAAIREYLTDVGPADYVLFAGSKAVGVVEAERVVVCRSILENVSSAEYHCRFWNRISC